MKRRMMLGIFVCVLIVFIAVVLQARVEETDKQDHVTASSTASTELRAVQEQLVEIHESQFAFVTADYRAGRVSYAEVINSKIELSTVKIRLAQHRGKSDEVITELRQIVTLREKALLQGEENFTGGEATAKELNLAKIDLLEAKADLFTSIIHQQ